MLVINMSFLVLLIVSSGYAALYGGYEGRIICGLVLIGAFGTRIALNLLEVHFGLPAITFTIDLLMLMVFAWIASRTDRYWPLWMLAFHLLSVLTFIAWLTTPKGVSRIFEDAAAFWSIPLLVVLFWGVHLDRRT